MAFDRLGRLLFIVPYVVSRDGVPISELSERLNVSKRDIEADIELLAMVGRPPLTPDHLIDLYVEDGIVYVELDQNLSRPLHLTHEEARALVLGAKLVGQLGGIGEELQAVLEKIICQLNPMDAQIVRSFGERMGVWQDNLLPLPAVASLRHAIGHKQEVKIDYYSVSSDRQKLYRLRPLALFNHSGLEYLVALDCDADLLQKLFRLDRIHTVAALDSYFEYNDEVDLDRFRKEQLFQGSGEGVTVHFMRSVVPWVKERFVKEQIVEQPDGSIKVKLATPSPVWLARWVLPFGTEAEVLAPKEQRQWLYELCEKAKAAYAA